MIHSAFLRSAAVGATALAMVATGIGAANAAGDSSRFHSSSTGTAANARVARASVDSSHPVSIDRFAVNPVAMRYSSGYAEGKAAGTVYPGVTSWYLPTVDVYRGSTKVGTSSYAISSNGSVAVQMSNSWGRGYFTLRNLHFDAFTNYGSGEYQYTQAATSGVIDVRSAIQGSLKYGNALTVVKRGARHTFNFGLKYYTTAGWRPLARYPIALQEKVGAKWKTIKRLRLNSLGKARYVRKTRKKYSYRIVVTTTSTLQGGHTTPTSRL